MAPTPSEMVLLFRKLQLLLAFFPDEQEMLFLYHVAWSVLVLPKKVMRPTHTAITMPFLKATDLQERVYRSKRTL